MQEEKYRRQATIFLRKINESRLFFEKHKPSIGYIGEHLLRKSLRSLMPKSYGICQGFVTYTGEISGQCDIIIYRREKNAIHKSYGELKIVNAESVVSVIEVKTSISQKTFHSTLRAFERLYALRVTNCFLFVYGKFTRKKMSHWLYTYKESNASTEQYDIRDNDLYDWDDKEWLPNSVLTLDENKYFRIDHISAYNGDWVGYTSLNIIDENDEQICCLQEFFSDICEGIPIDIRGYSIEDGITLFRF